MTISWNFEDRTVLITGAAQGIGAALVRFFLEGGAQVVGVDLDSGKLEETHGTVSGFIPLPIDISDSRSVQHAFAQHEVLQAVDILVNNAGITRDAMLWNLTDPQWQAVIDVHLSGTFWLTRAAVPQMRAKTFGRIVNVTSYTGLHGNLGQANYAAAKAGIVGLTKSAAKDLARFGITVNAISPNAVTPMVAAVPESERAALESAIPLGRFADPREICPAVGFLASAEAGYITGTVLTVDGGMSM